MDTREILKFCLDEGFLLDREVLNLFNETNDFESMKLILKEIKRYTHQKIITKNIFCENKDKLGQLLLELPKENRKNLEKLKIKLGLSIEISKEQKSITYTDTTQQKQENADSSFNQNGKRTSKKTLLNQKEKIEKINNVKILSMTPAFTKKLEVNDFVNYFRNRFSEMKGVLQDHANLDNLISINKISGNRQKVSLIGIVYSKKITKNKNILLGIEDLTGRINVLINKNKPDLYKKAEEISFDSVLGFKGSGDREIFFVDDIIFPDSMVFERKKSFVEECVLFIGDLHFGSKRFLEKNFIKFIDYLNGKTPNSHDIEKIKYLFIVGDLITGVGNYPNQEKDLNITDIEEQFVKIAGLLGKIRKDIKIIISPGNHDGVRLMEPQPPLDEKYAWPLYNLENVILTGNPCYVNIGSTQNFQGFNILTYHGFSFPYYANNIPSLILGKAMNSPEKIMKYLLKNRHLAPTHSSVQYFPSKQDFLMIKKVPDIFVAGHTHKSAITYYNNVLLVSVSSWEEKTPYQEKFGNEPDHCKVPLFNLKTRAVKILDFE